MKKSLKSVGLLLLLAVVGYQSVYIKSLKDVQAKDADFNAKTYASTFFKNDLLPLRDSAVALPQLLQLLQTNKEEGFRRYGHALSIGSIKYFLVKGEGTVEALQPNRATLRLHPDSVAASAKLATEFVFGNAIRDASGKIALAGFSNLSDINNISMELNKIVRTTVLPPFNKEVATGRTVRFFGAVELNQERLNLEALEIIPIQLEIVPSE